MDINTSLVTYIHINHLGTQVSFCINLTIATLYTTIINIRKPCNYRFYNNTNSIVYSTKDFISFRILTRTALSYDHNFCSSYQMNSIKNYSYCNYLQSPDRIYVQVILRICTSGIN